ncbi:methyl-accepting chemotaxis protein [Myxosarcina sp. GI1]|uniref:methyl-accepting chemotaxis protein n=1 Tax=Myxosarcina sp. GI1 TaxID=1541065 RepID=UPI00056CA41A|nr:methyl-accepting chemotaxis protein [Myxosarcina sp. GI1]
MKISTQLSLTAAGIVVVAVGSIGSVFLGASSGDSRVVNYSGIVRGATQRLVKQELTGQSNDKLIAKLDQIVNGLINGDEELNLPRATDPEYFSIMLEVESAWNQLKENIVAARTNEASEAILYENSEEFFELINNGVFAAEDAAAAKLRRLRIIQLVIFGINLIIIGIIITLTRRITATLKSLTSAIASSSTEIAATIDQQERTVASQASSVNQTTATVDELGASSRQSAEQAEASTAGASQALSLAQEGARTVEQTMAGIENLKVRVGEIAEQIINLSQQTGQIAIVSDLVANVANQTNMLALNAAVEASRAGEHGKGFGVVADEIRKLADESRKSAEKINNLVVDLQAAMNSAVMVTDEGNKTAESSIQLARGTAETFVSVKNAIDDVFINTQQISLNTKQQAVGIQEILSAINALNLGAQDTAAGINQVKVSTANLRDSAKDLQEIV